MGPAPPRAAGGRPRLAGQVHPHVRLAVRGPGHGPQLPDRGRRAPLHLPVLLRRGDRVRAIPGHHLLEHVIHSYASETGKFEVAQISIPPSIPILVIASVEISLRSDPQSFG